MPVTNTPFQASGLEVFDILPLACECFACPDQKIKGARVPASPHQSQLK